MRRVAVVTGGGSGIGREVALALRADGFTVAVLGRNAGNLVETAELGGGGDNWLTVSCDVGNPSDVKAAFDRVVDEWGRVDLLFNNAGVFPPGRILDEVTDEHWSSAVRTNLDGAFYATREAFKVMKKQLPQGGRIINNGSISSHSPRPHSSAYTATKHAISGLTKATALDGRPYDIACGQIDIGNAATELAARIHSGVLQADGSMRGEPTMDLAHVVSAVLYMVRLPLGVNVHSMTVMATKMPFVGRG